MKNVPYSLTFFFNGELYSSLFIFLNGGGDITGEVVTLSMEMVMVEEMRIPPEEVMKMNKLEVEAIIPAMIEVMEVEMAVVIGENGGSSARGGGSNIGRGRDDDGGDGCDGGGERGGRGNQVTIFKGGGIAVGYSVHHTVVDGKALLQFVQAWTSACRAKMHGVDFPVHKPLYNRVVIKHPKGEEMAREFFRNSTPNLPSVRYGF